MLIDVKKAYLNGEVPGDEKVFVLLPSEAGGGVARLKRWLFGTRLAANAWEEHGATRLTEEGGSRRGTSAATVFWQLGWGVRWASQVASRGVERNGTERNGTERNMPCHAVPCRAVPCRGAVPWHGMEWNGMEWNGWNGMECMNDA